ncbi:hypothetical protein [Lactobacillus hominis]|uniref:hypothetical protein n=1 Tax=Lactobacillus hominis TaxID=1203033 RepID=UPI0023F215DD|nr:hypothetical protein [Lactobacillus hominis]
MKKKSLKKVALLGLVSLGLATSGTAFAASKTVYYKGTPVYWEYGKTAGVWSYSKVQSHRYQHSATANGVWSGWKNRGTLAVANTWIAPNAHATAYWDCR